MESLISTKSQSWLSWFLRGILILGFLILVSRVFELQVIKGAYFRDLSEDNRIRETVITAPRGKIIARGGEVLSGAEFAHVTGYLAEANEDEVGKVDPLCIEKGSRTLKQLVGRGGLNQEYNCTLTGIDGAELVEVDTTGENLRTLGSRVPTPGSDIKTTIDYSLQKKVASEMEGKKGAVVITDPNGEVLALYSSPSFDPLNVKDYLTDKDLPFFNRAIGGSFHPGSVFKPLVVTAALEEGKIDKDFRFVDEGVLTVKTLYGDFSYSNWYFTQYGQKEGEIDLIRALARSTDTFFYTIGEMLGPDKIFDWAKKFNLTEKTGIDIPGEISGLVPTPSWKEEVMKENWFLGNTYHLSIGQGDVSLTPIGVNTMISTVANGSKLCKPHILESDNAEKCIDIGVREENLDLVREGMKEACSTGGTGYTFFDFVPQVGCKTGTAEVGLEEDTHAWFSLFAPFNNPEIVVTVLVERGGEGSKVAGPIARNIMNQWLLLKNP